MLKQYIQFFLRQARLLLVADLFYFGLKHLRSIYGNYLFHRQHPNFSTPPLLIAYEAYHHADWQLYYNTGKKQAKLFAALIDKYGAQTPNRILEWGCGPGRIIRHMPGFLANSKNKLYGCDINPKSIVWCRNNLQEIIFSENFVTPSLLYTDEFFDVVYGHSVLSHLRIANHYPWIKELARICRPHGLVILTSQGEFFRTMMLPSERQLFDSGTFVERQFLTEGKKFFLTFHPPRAMRALIENHFEIVAHFPSDSEEVTPQDVWVCRK